MLELLSRGLLFLWAAFTLVGCASSADKPKPAALPAFTASLAVQKVWSVQLGEVSTPLTASVQGSRVAMASSAGDLVLIESRTGTEVWRMKFKERIQAGVGGDGQRFAVVSQGNELIVVENGREMWRHRLQAGTFTAPLVAGGRVFVLTADRTALAFDAVSGRRLWEQQRNSDALVLRQAGLLSPWNDTLMVGFEGRLLGLHPLTGVPRWEAVVGRSRGTNEVERLVDVVAGMSRLGNSVCARSFQTAVTCIDASRGAVLWTASAQGYTGVTGDDQRVYGTESDSKVIAWNRQTGQVAWSQEALRFRGLGAPLLMGSVLVMGDEDGLLHFLSSDNGKVVQRLSTNGTAVVMQPVLADKTLLIVNQSGLLTGYRTE